MNLRFGIFDSGVGGFTVLKKIWENYGDVPCVYLGDTARLPYGSKTSLEIKEIAKEVVDWLRIQEVNAILVACNTTNALAMDVVRDLAGVPSFGLIDSVGEIISEDRIGVLSTPSTFSSRAYTKNILRFNPSAIVIEQACPAFVPLIEMGQINGSEIRKVALDYLEPLLIQKVDAIVLGCSHYPLLYPLLRDLIPSNVRLIDPAVGLIKKLASLKLEKKKNYSTAQTILNTRFIATSDPVGFASRAQYWLGIKPEIELVSMRSRACVF